VSGPVVFPAIGQALLLLVIVRGLYSGTFPRYLLFYLYMCYVLLAALSVDVSQILYGWRSREYYFVYHIPNLLAPLFQVAILTEILYRVFGNTKLALRRIIESVILVLTIALPVAWKVFSLPNVSIFERYHAVMLFVQMLACVIVLRRIVGQKDVDPGRNLRGILVGICLLVGLQGMNFANYFFKETSFMIFSFSLQFVYFVALAVFGYTLWNYDPVKIVRPDIADRLDHVSKEVEKAVRGLMSR